MVSRRKFLAACGSALFAGCAGLHESARPAGLVSELPRPCRSAVYVFLFEGADPLGLAHLEDLRNEIIAAGFPKVYRGEAHHRHFFAREAASARLHEPECRFLVAGYGRGAEQARRLAEEMSRVGIAADTLAYLEPCAVGDAPGAADRLVVFQAAGSKPAAIAEGEYYSADCAHSWQVPTHPDVVRALVAECARLAAAVPTAGYGEEELPPLVDPHPLPRPVLPAPAPAGEWEFLEGGALG